MLVTLGKKPLTFIRNPSGEAPFLARIGHMIPLYKWQNVLDQNLKKNSPIVNRIWRAFCYCWYYFTSHFHFIYIFFHCCALCTNICHCLLAHVFNPESEYSTSQLLTSDSSCLLSCLSLTQPCSNVLHTFTHAPHITSSV